MTTQVNRARVKAPAYLSPDVDVRSTLRRVDDGASLNPQGREVLEGNKNVRNFRNFLNCKNYCQVGTFNARTLRAEHKRTELAHQFGLAKLDILCVVDHKIIHEEPLKIEALKNCKLYTTSAVQNARGAAVGVWEYWWVKKLKRH